MAKQADATDLKFVGEIRVGSNPTTRIKRKYEKKRTFSDEEFVKAVKESKSFRQILLKLNLEGTGGNYASVRKKIKELNLDISHLGNSKERQGWAKGKKFEKRYRISLSDILKENVFYQSHKLKLRLIKEGLFERKCYNCGLSTWLDNPIPIELEHKNGISTDNRLENLTILCPNCHALTETYRGKNIKK